jgi:single-stranded DNA-binding protein
MLDPQNLVNLTGGIVADPEIVNGKIFKTRLAIDYAGSEKDSDNNSGYFEIVYYLKNNSGFVSQNAEFVSSQVTQGKLKKGSTVSLIGRLVQERWKGQDGKGNSRVTIVVEHLSYAKSSRSSGTSSASASSSDTPVATSANAVPSSF